MNGDQTYTPGERNSQENSNGKGPLIGSIIVILILIAGLAYLWQNFPEQSPGMPSGMSGEDIENLPDEATQSLESQSSSDEISAIEADLNSTDLHNIDAELDTINAELNSVE